MRVEDLSQDGGAAARRTDHEDRPRDRLLGDLGMLLAPRPTTHRAPTPPLRPRQPGRAAEHRQAAQHGDLQPVRRLNPGDNARQVILQTRLLRGIDEGDGRLLIGSQGNQTQIDLFTGRQADAFHTVFNGPLFLLGIGLGVVNFHGYPAPGVLFVLGEKIDDSLGKCFDMCGRVHYVFAVKDLNDHILFQI